MVDANCATFVGSVTISDRLTGYVEAVEDLGGDRYGLETIVENEAVVVDGEAGGVVDGEVGVVDGETVVVMNDVLDSDSNSFQCTWTGSPTRAVASTRRPRGNQRPPASIRLRCRRRRAGASRSSPLRTAASRDAPNVFITSISIQSSGATCGYAIYPLI